MLALSPVRTLELRNPPSESLPGGGRRIGVVQGTFARRLFRVHERAKKELCPFQQPSGTRASSTNPTYEFRSGLRVPVSCCLRIWFRDTSARRMVIGHSPGAWFQSERRRYLRPRCLVRRAHKLSLRRGARRGDRDGDGPVVSGRVEPGGSNLVDGD